eukprot:4198420-Ditylum_brightwellii.AAC.1
MRAAIRPGFLGGNLPSLSTTQAKPIFTPSTNPNDVLVKVKSAAINPVDYKLPKFVAGPIFGLDFSGVVENVGESVTDFAIGDAVFGTTPTGSLADYTVVDTKRIAKFREEDWSFLEAAALPTAYVTSLQGLKVGKVSEGSSVLIIGASGGCGLAAVHLAKAMGADRIIAICSGKNAQLVTEAGATEVVYYNRNETLQAFFDENEGKIQCVYDAATGSGRGEEYTETSMSLLIPDSGEYVQLNGPTSVWLKGLMLKRLAQHQHLIITDMNTADLEEVLLSLKEINVKPLMNVMPFTEEGIKEGFDLLKSRRTKGKIVFDLS